MKQSKYCVALTAALAVALGACQSEEIDLFSTDDSLVYFQQVTSTSSNGSETYGNSVAFSFVGYSEKMTSVVFRGEIRSLGKVRDYDRKVAITIDDEHTTMERGVDFECDLDTIVIPAGASVTRVPIRFLRNLGFREKADTLVLKLQENENFKLLGTYKKSNSYSSSSDATVDGTRFSFVIDEVYSCPGSWYTLNATKYFGVWTATKYIFINTTLGFELSDWTWINGAGSKITTGRMPYYAIKLQKILQERADAKDPVYDEDGNFMQLGEGYRVDYSAYRD